MQIGAATRIALYLYGVLAIVFLYLPLLSVENLDEKQ